MAARNSQRVLYMKMILVLGLLISCVSPVFAEEDEHVLQTFAATLLKASTNGPLSIALTGSYKQSQEKDLLVFRLTNLSPKPLSLLPSSLPWGNPHSITLAALTTDGHQLTYRFPIADPPIFEKEITIAPSQTITGEYDLEWHLEISEAPKGKDILLLWAYRGLSNINGGSQIYSGVVLIPRK